MGESAYTSIPLKTIVHKVLALTVRVHLLLTSIDTFLFIDFEVLLSECN